MSLSSIRLMNEYTNIKRLSMRAVPLKVGLGFDSLDQLRNAALLDLESL